MGSISHSAAKAESRLTHSTNHAPPLKPEPAVAAAPARAPAPPTPDEIWANMPTADEIFDRPYDPPATPLPEAWTEDSLARDFADEECIRLIVNSLFTPPLTEEEIEQYAVRYGLPCEQAERELRRARHGRT